MERIKRKQTTILLSLLVIVFVVSMSIERPAYLEKFQLAVDDMVYNLGLKKGKLDDIVIVAIDNQSINTIGRWPWHRNKLAELVSGVALRNPKVIAMDIILPRDFEEDTLGYTDQLASAIKAAGNVVLPFYFTISQRGRIIDNEIPDAIYHNSFVLFDNPMTIGSYPIPRAIEIYPPAEQLSEAARALGDVNILPDVDGKVRWEPLVVTYNSHYFPSFALQTARLYKGLSAGGVKLIGGKAILLGSDEIPTDASMRTPIRYSGGYNTFKYISAIDILNGNIGAEELEGKIALIGYVAADNRDVVATPVTEMLPGVEMQATVVENITNLNVFKGVQAAVWINLILILIFGIVGIIIMPRMALNYRIAVLVGCLFILFNIVYFFLVNYNILLQFFFPALELMLFLAIAPLYEPKKQTSFEKTGRSQIEQADNTIYSNQMENSGSQTIIAPSNAIPKKMGRYELEGVLGRGAMGTVYKGVDPAIGRPVAIKTIRIDRLDSTEEAEEMIRRLNQEAHSAGRLSHPNIITIYDVGRERNLQYIAMEYLEGNTLEELLKENERLDFYRTAKILKQTADALSYAHKQSVIHRDIKPANIMVLAGDMVKVMDFGIARMDNMHMTQTGITVGTPNYISPEQLQGKILDGRADIFSAGIVLYESLTGTRPFQADNLSALVVNILNVTPPPPSQINSEIPKMLDMITMKALEKKPDNRYQDAYEFAFDLRRFLGEDTSLWDGSSPTGKKTAKNTIT